MLYAANNISHLGRITTVQRVLPIHNQILILQKNMQQKLWISELRNISQQIHIPEYSMTSSGDFPSTSRAILSISSRPYFSLALMNWLKSLLFQFVKPCKQQEIKKPLLRRKATSCLMYVSLVPTDNASAVPHSHSG